MWSAIKSDFLDFVNVIKDDTSKTISKVLGDGRESEEDEEAIIAQALQDLIRSFHTYSDVICY